MTLNPKAAVYQPQEETVRALVDHPTSDLSIARRSARIRSRLINNWPNSQDISNTDRCEKADASIQSDTTTGDDGRIPRLTLSQTVDTDGAESAIVQEEEGELDDVAQQTGHDDGDDGSDNIETTHRKTGTAGDNQESVDHEVQNVENGIVISNLLEGLLQVPNIMENDYMSDQSINQS